MKPMFALACALFFFLSAAAAQNYIPTNDPAFYGPFNGSFWAGGEGINKSLVKGDTVMRADSPWTLYGWVWLEEPLTGPSLIAGFGDPAEEYSRYIGVDGDKLILWGGKDNSLSAASPLAVHKWQFIAASFDGNEFHLFTDAGPAASGKLDLGSVAGAIELAPAEQPWPNASHFSGKLAGFSLLRRALSAEEVRALAAKPLDFAGILYEEGSKPWPLQNYGQSGYRAPQDPATLPQTRAPFSAPVKKPASTAPALQAGAKNEWILAGGWKLRPAPEVKAPGEAIAQSEFSTRDWWPATMPGTVLTTMIDQGVYPDSDYGLNNLVIPETLNKQDYWYRTEFNAPADWKGRHLTLTFEGINYAASVWLNGKQLGTIKGAFIRGVYDVTSAIKLGQSNVLAVRVSPPPHPGIPHEQSIKAGAGENGGIMCLDGPTFVDTEGWDWIPAIRDRATGIWQQVTLRATSSVRLGDPQVVTHLPLPATNQATVELTVPLLNETSSPVRGTVAASFENVIVSKQVTLTPGKNEIKLAAAEFPQLVVQNPRLWWPNGYGKPELYALKLSFSEGGRESDSRELRFGIREITYEISLLDSTGHLRRVDYSPTVAREKNEQIVDISHSGIRNIPNHDPYPSILPVEWREGWKAWVASLKPGAENSAAAKPVDDTRAAPWLTLHVNGVRIAARGGSWGMDDSRKRVSRERLEPYFRLHRDANVNIIRNWVGQSTEEAFYDLADEYGLLVWNDFWASTQNYNIEPEDPQLFLDNARDVILRFRNHPSIAVWCGRNEGVPQPILNLGLDDLIRTLDGTRYYTPTSNQVNLQNSGPYRYVDPRLYFNELNHGFSVETGTPSFPTNEMWRAWIPSADLWPISDAWAYHDWHQTGNGDMTPFMSELEKQFGAATSLDDFERKAQMLNYVQHRAIFEGMNSHLWAPNTGRMLWMTQPAWPSSTWQIFSSDYDTQSSFYGVKKGSETLHIQLDPTTFQVQVANSLPATAAGLQAQARVLSLDNKVVATLQEKKDVPSGVTEFGALDLAPQLKDNLVFVKLELRDAAGKLVSDNLYWMGGSAADYRKLNRLPAAQLAVTTSTSVEKGSLRIHVRIENIGASPAIQTKLTLLGADAATRVLPAYYGDNYISLLPGETREIDIETPAAAGGLTLGLRGWNVTPKTLQVAAK